MTVLTTALTRRLVAIDERPTSTVNALVLDDGGAYRSGYLVGPPLWDVNPTLHLQRPVVSVWFVVTCGYWLFGWTNRGGGFAVRAAPPPATPSLPCPTCPHRHPPPPTPPQPARLLFLQPPFTITATIYFSARFADTQLDHSPFCHHHA